MMDCSTCQATSYLRGPAGCPAGQEGSLLLDLFWGGQIEFNAPAVFPTEPESMAELAPQKEAALFAIVGVGSAHPAHKQLCVTNIRATYGEEVQVCVPGCQVARSEPCRLQRGVLHASLTTPLSRCALGESCHVSRALQACSCQSWFLGYIDELSTLQSSSGAFTCVWHRQDASHCYKQTDWQ